MLTISGENLGGATNARIGNASVPLTINSAAQITAQITGNVSTGFIYVDTPSGTAVSATEFTVTAPPPSPPPLNIPNIWTGGTAYNAGGFQILPNDDIINPDGQGWFWFRSRVALTQDGDWAEFEHQPMYAPMLLAADHYTKYFYLLGNFSAADSTENGAVELAPGDRIKFELTGGNQVKAFKNGVYVYTFRRLRNPAQPLYVA